MLARRRDEEGIDRGPEAMLVGVARGVEHAIVERQVPIPRGQVHPPTLKRLAVLHFRHWKGGVTIQHGLELAAQHGMTVNDDRDDGGTLTRQLVEQSHERPDCPRRAADHDDVPLGPIAVEYHGASPPGGWSPTGAVHGATGSGLSVSRISRIRRAFSPALRTRMRRSSP